MKITTKKYIDGQMKWLAELRKADKQYLEAEITAIRRAVDKYSDTNDERWVGANEFRSQLKDQAGTFLTRRELWLAGMAIVGVIIAIVQLLLKK